MNHTMNVIPMTQAFPAIYEAPAPRLTCFSCGEPVTIEELLLVDYLIEHSPCFQDISENFAHCTGDDSLFHDNIVNCDATCYAAIVQTIAPCDEVVRRAEIDNLVLALRANPIIPVRAIVTLERLLENLIAIGPRPDLMHDELAEALYCKMSPLYPLLS